MMIINLVDVSTICLLLIGLSVHQTKSDSIRYGIIMNGANETVDSANIALADGSIDKNAVQQKSVDDNVHDVTRHFPINGSIQQQQQIDSGGSVQFDEYLSRFLADHPGAEVVEPNDKVDNKDYEFHYSYPKAQIIEVVVHLLDINPYTNWLHIGVNPTSNSQPQLNLTEHIEPPNIKQITFKNAQAVHIHMKFTNSEWSRYRGFVLTIHPLAISQFDPTSDNDAKRPDSSVAAQSQPNRVKLLIEVPQAKQINETWTLFRKLLANSTNKFINVNGINAEKCSEDNVTLANINPCRTAWPNAQNCIEMHFSVRLNSLPKGTNQTNQTNTENVNGTDMFEFDRAQLIHLWVDFGRDELAKNGFKEFLVPDAQKLLFVWSMISLCVVGAFLLVLFGIWKMDLLHDYRRMYWKNGGEDEKQICKSSDMSMYPPVHQIVPTLFPNELSTANNTTNTLPFEFVNRPITFDVSDFERRPSLEESLKPIGNVKRKAGEVPFQTDSECNETKQDRPDDEIYLSNRIPSPRLVN